MVKNFSRNASLLIALLVILWVIVSLIDGETTSRWFSPRRSGIVRYGEDAFWMTIGLRVLGAAVLFYLFYRDVKPDDDQTF